MSSHDVETVYFNDGCVKERDYVYISSKLHSLDPAEHDFSRMSFVKNRRWAKHDLEWDVRSVCFWASENCLCALSSQGDVNFATSQGFSSEKIADAGTAAGLGAVKQIRAIDATLWVCGDQGQVYRRTASGWHHDDEGLLDRRLSVEALDLNGIDGTSEDDVYVVGFHGRIFHRGRDRWRELASPTTRHLERVRCLTPTEVYVCGNSGTFLRGNEAGFEDLSVKGLEAHFWGLECFQGKVYLATLAGLYVFDGETVEPLRTGLVPEIGGYRLDARDGVLWSFGVDDLACFDGQRWTRVDHPDNPLIRSGESH